MTFAKPFRLVDRLGSLKKRHADLDNRIRDEMARPMPDGLRVQTLKRMRLQAKDQIALVSRQMTSPPGAGQPEAA